MGKVPEPLSAGRAVRECAAFFMATVLYVTALWLVVSLMVSVAN